MIEPEDVKHYGRQIQAMLRKAGDDPEAFATVVGLLDIARQGLPDAARQLCEQGFSWAEIARPLGITRQAAQQRYADRD